MPQIARSLPFAIAGEDAQEVAPAPGIDPPYPKTYRGPTWWGV